ncbi:adenylate kinase isoenzyme 6 homolog isoform X2 [Solanum lycopersicum]|uniref:Adenylate kinase isoenzyme 6 homolog n=1 Tax=Solanum lycopersicum TaxID=4081 RepID=A0A3Q7HWM6_SOLLC|nr:adenylate kinase isoenzyme 6 homolog isoform X2 [Solanum lycopersicum]
MTQNSSGRKRPNILITGTPGTGKTTTAAALAEVTALRHINVGDFANEENLTNGWDDTFDCYYINEDLVCDALEKLMEEGGNIVDHHACDFFPECCFDCVVVLQTDSSVLHERFTKRGYSDHKLATNTECQIFQALLDEVKENYPDDILVILRSDFLEDITKNVETLTSWISNLSPAV